MRTDIKQRHLSSYIGYWQMINAADELVISDNTCQIIGGRGTIGSL